MHGLRRTTIAVLVALLLTLTACGNSAKQPSEQSTSLEAVRQQAAEAFDGTISSARRRTAADAAMRELLLLLNQPDSAAISDEEWARAPRPRADSLVRHEDLGEGVHLYALTLPGDSLVEVRERVAVQVRRGGSSLAAAELSLLPGSRLKAARTLKEGGRRLLTLALSLNAGGGYIAHFEAEGNGQFRLASGALNDLAGQYGEIALAMKDGFLHVNQPEAVEWQPSFDAREPLRLLISPGLTLDWKQRFVLIDDSQFDAFALFRIAFDPKSCRDAESCPETLLAQAGTGPETAVAQRAWEQAAAKLTADLQRETSWADEFTGRLPEGSRSLREQGRGLSVRLLSIPGPEGVTPAAFTAVQSRVGQGIPTTRTISLPGAVESFKVMDHGGRPALFILVDQTADAGSPVRRMGLYLYRGDADNSWVRAVGWVGSVPNAPHWNLNGVTPDSVGVEWDVDQTPGMTVSLTGDAEPALRICKSPNSCHQLTWLDGKLHAMAILNAQMYEAMRSQPEPELMWRAAQLAEFVATLDPARVSRDQMIAAIAPTRNMGLQVLEAGDATRVIALPPNPTGVQAAVVHARGQGLVFRAQNGLVTRWDGARVVQGGGQQRLLVLGRSDKAAVLFTFQWDGSRWVEVDPLETKFDKVLMEATRIMFTPGQTSPARGIIVLGGEVLSASLTATGARFCENNLACVTYGYVDGWRLE